MNQIKSKTIVLRVYPQNPNDYPQIMRMLKNLTFPCTVTIIQKEEKQK